MIVLVLEILIWYSLGQMNLHLHFLAACFRCDPVRKEVAGTLDCRLRQLGKAWLQIHAGLFVVFFSLHENKSYFQLVFIDIKPEELT